jgi:5-methylthioadenosine/S-adenosylhomocysteine deaminase
VAQLQHMVRSGTVGHLDFREEGVKGAQILRAASEQVGLDSIILSQWMTSPFDSATLMENKAELTDAYKQDLDAMLAVGDGFSESTMNDMTDPAWKYIKDRTKELGKFRAIHCLENEGYRNLSLKMAYRGDLIRALEIYEPDIIVHMTVATPQEQQLLADSGTTGVFNPRANANLGLPLPPIRGLLEAGANMLLGTDNAMLNNSNMLAELDFTYKVAKSQFGDAVHPAPQDILKLATVNIRKVFGGDRYGYLEKGLPADFVVLDFSKPRLRHTHHLLASIVTRLGPEDVLATVLKGKPLYSRL